MQIQKQLFKGFLLLLFLFLLLLCTTKTTSAHKKTSASLMISQAAQAVLTVINQERSQVGLPPLQISNALIQSAHKHNLAMLARSQLSHQLPGEPDLGTRLTRAGIAWRMAAENIGFNWGDPTQAAVSLNRSMFAERPPQDGHRQNILSRNNTVGIDVLLNTNNGQIWLTEDFAQVTLCQIGPRILF